VKTRRLNEGPDHLSHIETGEEPTNLEEALLDTQIFVLCITASRFKDIIHPNDRNDSRRIYKSIEEGNGSAHGRIFDHCIALVKNGVR